MKKSLFARCRTNFLTGLAIILPTVISIGVVVWLFRNVSSVTDALLFFLPKSLTHENQGNGPVIWYWSAFALGLAVILIGFIGQLTRYYLGKKVIEFVDHVLLRVPLINKIYLTIKQVNEAFSPENKSGFKQVVLIEYPRTGCHTVGFLTSGPVHDLPEHSAEKMVSVFVPTTPNPTSGFLLILPDSQVTRLDMSVAEGIKYIISLGAISRESSAGAAALRPLPESTRSLPTLR
jgi:uncharacterized membrane protein